MYRRETDAERKARKSFAAPWNPARTYTRRAFQRRYVVDIDGKERSLATAAEALKLARLYADIGADVSVRDRARRRGYLSETDLEAIAMEETHAQGT